MAIETSNHSVLPTSELEKLQLLQSIVLRIAEGKKG